MEIQDTFAEAFGIQVSRLLVTAATKKLAKIAATEATGYGTSVIGCPAEAGIDCYVPPEETPDGRPGYVIMICNMDKKKLDHELLERVGMCILTAATTAVFDAMEDPDEKMTTGKKTQILRRRLREKKQKSMEEPFTPSPSWPGTSWWKKNWEYDPVLPEETYL